MSKSLIIKVDNHSLQTTRDLRKTIGTIGLKECAKVINSNDLDANPRKAKVGTITDQVLDTLNFDSEMFRFRNKGFLLIANNLYKLERNRVSIDFENSKYEGLGDGGHTLLGIGMYLLKFTNISEEAIAKQKIRTWDAFIDFWRTIMTPENFESLLENIDKHEEKILQENRVAVPVEIVTPTEVGRMSFEQNAYDICEARNNNVSLTITTRSNQRGYYDPLKPVMDPYIEERTQWKDNEDLDVTPTFSVKDVVSLTMIPLYKLQQAGLLHKDVKSISPSYTYNGKGNAVQIFNSIIELEGGLANDNDKEVSSDDMIKNIKSNSVLMSALSSMRQIPSLVDTVYSLMPDAYQRYVVNRFGKSSTKKKFTTLQGVKKYSRTKKGEEYISRQQTTPFYSQPSEYQIPAGFYMPFVAGIHEMLEIKNNQVVWGVESPSEFIEQNVDTILEPFFDYLVDDNPDPTVVGKKAKVYRDIEREISRLI